MSVAVRYYSRSGNTKALADAIAEAASVKAVSVDEPGAALADPVDVLFIGGALYAYGLDKHLKEYISRLKKTDAKKAVIFSTSWISKHSVALIRKGLEEAGIPVEEEYLYAKNHPDVATLKRVGDFVAKFVDIKTESVTAKAM